MAREPGRRRYFGAGLSPWCTPIPVWLCRMKGRAGNGCMKLSPRHPPGGGDIRVPSQASVLLSRRELGISELCWGCCSCARAFPTGTGQQPGVHPAAGPTPRLHEFTGADVLSNCPLPGVTPFGENQCGHLFSKHILQPTSYRWTSGYSPEAPKEKCPFLRSAEFKPRSQLFKAPQAANRPCTV